MKKALYLSMGLLLLAVLVSTAISTVAPPAPAGTPYYSALSTVAVETAEACPCNLKICSNNHCVSDPTESHGCCIQGTTCKYGPCF